LQRRRVRVFIRNLKSYLLLRYSTRYLTVSKEKDAVLKSLFLSLNVLECYRNAIKMLGITIGDTLKHNREWSRDKTETKERKIQTY
jgi:hypothetical protein